MHVAARCCAASQRYIAAVARSVPCHAIPCWAMPCLPIPTHHFLPCWNRAGRGLCNQPSVQHASSAWIMQHSANYRAWELMDGRGIFFCCPSGGMKGRIQCSSSVSRSMKCCREDVWGSGSIWGSSACRKKVGAAPAQLPCTCLQQTCCSQWDFAMVFKLEVWESCRSKAV